MPVRMRLVASRQGVTSATTCSGGGWVTLPSSRASNSCSSMDSQSGSRISLTSQQFPQPLFQPVEPALHRPLRGAQFGGNLSGGL